MSHWYEQVKILSPAPGYHISGTIYLAYGHNFEEVTRDINEYIQGQDAVTLVRAESKGAMAQMIANVYNDLDIEEDEPHFAIRHLSEWNLIIL